MGIISYFEDNQILRQNSNVAEAKNYLLFSDLLFHVTSESVTTVDYKLALCIPLDLCNKLFELYHSGLPTSHQGLTLTYYKIRQYFFHS